MNKTKNILILVFIFSILLSGCTSSSFDQKPIQKAIIPNPELHGLVNSILSEPKEKYLAELAADKKEKAIDQPVINGTTTVGPDGKTTFTIKPFTNTKINPSDLKMLPYTDFRWEKVFPSRIASDELNAIKLSAIRDLGTSKTITSRPIFSPFEDILNYPSSELTDYSLIDQQIGDKQAFLLYDTTHYSKFNSKYYHDIYCMPFVKESEVWHIKNARFVEQNSYQELSLKDTNIQKTCLNFIKTQPSESQAATIEGSISYTVNAFANFDLYINGILIKSANETNKMPSSYAGFAKDILLNGQNELTIKTGLTDPNKSRYKPSLRVWDDNNPDKVIAEIDLAPDKEQTITFNLNSPQ